MKYIIGLIIGVVLMTNWPQQTRLVFSNALEYIELGIDKARDQMDNKAKSGLGSNAELMMGMIFLSGVSDASLHETLDALPPKTKICGREGKCIGDIKRAQ